MRPIETKKITKVNKKKLIVGVDIAKVKNFGYLRCQDGTEIKPFVFFNRRPGFDKFWERITNTMKAHNLKEVIIGVESTGPYAEPLLHYLMKKDVELVQVNPMHTKKLKELQGNSPNKTDKKDAAVIADIIELGHTLRVVIPEGTEAELRRLTNARESAKEDLTSVMNRLHSLTFVIFPEFLEVMKGLRSKTAQYILEHCPCANDVVEFGAEALSQAIKKVSCGQLGKERAMELYEAAKNSIGVQEGQQGIIFEIKHLLTTIKSKKSYIEELEKLMSCYLEEIPYSKFILSIKGIGKITTAGLIGEVGDFAKFETISQIIKLAGLDLFEISSGEHKGQRHISKRGRSLMRKLLFFAAINVVRKGGIMHDQYQKYLDREMPKMKALIAISKKLLGIIFALVRNQNEYISDYEEKRKKLKDAA